MARISRRLFTPLSLSLLLPGTASAAVVLPWQQTLNDIRDALSGDIARAIAVIVFVITGFLIAFGEARGMFSLFLRIAFGVSMALMATQWMGFFTPAGVGP